MPITIDNGFPNITINLGQQADSFELVGLFDTCGSLNTGYLPFHAWIASMHPSAVAEFRYYNGNDPFAPVKLEGAVTDPTGTTNSNHGLLTAVIRYKTAYVDSDGSPITLSFALGDDVSTNTIFGLPTITALQFVVDMTNMVAFSRCLNRTFHLVKSSGNLGLPKDVTFDTAAYRTLYDASLAVSPTTLNTWASTGASPIPPPGHLAGVDDTSNGYLRRSVSYIDS